MEQVVTIEGPQAKRFKVVALDSLADLHKGQLISADTMTGTFSWYDHVTGEPRTVHVPPHSIKIVLR